MIDGTKLNLPKSGADPRSAILIAAASLILFSLLAVVFWLTLDEGFLKSAPNMYMLPWIGATGVVLLAPTFYLLYRRKFDPFHPLVQAAWTYWFPSFVVGGILIATDVIYPYQMSLLNDTENDFAWTYIHIMVGFGAMTLGYILPWGRKLGVVAGRRLPLWDWTPREVLLPAMVLLGVGLFFYVSAFFSGVVGFSVANAADSFSALNYTLSLLTLQAGFLVAMFIFKSPRITVEHLLAFGVITIILVTRLSLGGNRSSLLLIVTLLAMAFVYSGRKLSVKAGAAFAGLVVLALMGGMIYGTTFRRVKESEDRVTIDQQLQKVGETVDNISSQDSVKILGEGIVSLAERVDGVSSVAVVVSNYEKLKPYEAAYGIENNIFTDMWTSFIPRFLWADKPMIFDARSYSDLYFNFSGNSYALTPVGDLLRNYGPIGVPVGMFLVGLFLRFAYAALIEDQVVTIGRATTYYMFLVSLSYEGFYSTIFIYGWRVFGIVFVSFVLLEFFLIRKKRL